MSIRARLLILVVAVLAPALLAAVWGVTRMYQGQQEAAEDALRQLTQALAAVVGQELAQREAVLRTLASSPAITRGDLAAFYHFAKAIAPTAERTLVLSEPDGRQVMNTRLPLEARLPVSASLPRLRRELGLPPEAALVSNLYFAPVGKRHSFALQVPVVRQGKVVYYLAMGSYANTLQKLLDDQRLREGWNAAVIDRNGTVIARRIEPEKFVGKPVTNAMLAHLRQAREGLFETVRLDGVRRSRPTSRSATPAGPSPSACPKPRCRSASPPR